MPDAPGLWCVKMLCKQLNIQLSLKMLNSVMTIELQLS
jgi:hypothetical protein